MYINLYDLINLLFFIYCGFFVSEILFLDFEFCLIDIFLENFIFEIFCLFFDGLLKLSDILVGFYMKGSSKFGCLFVWKI